MSIKILLALLTTSLMLTACGGSGAGNNATSTQLGNDENDSVNDGQITQPEIAMHNLVADEQFEFINKNQIRVELDLSAELASLDRLEQRAYISIYGAYHELVSGEYFVENANRVLAGDLQDGYYKSLFTQLGNQQEYLVEVWFYNGEPPLQKLLSIEDNRLTW